MPVKVQKITIRTRLGDDKSGAIRKVVGIDSAAAAEQIEHNWAEIARRTPGLEVNIIRRDVGEVPGKKFGYSHISKLDWARIFGKK